MANYQYVTGSGVIIADVGDIKTTVQGEYQTALGADIDLTDSTPQGELITAETAARSAVVQNNAAIANQINPNFSGGIFLDALWALTGGQRAQQTYTTAPATLAGDPGAIIPAGAQAATVPAGDIFQLLEAVTLTGGTGTGIFQAVQPGPVPCPAGELTQIVTAQVGWETVTNTAGTVGVATQSDASARQARRQTLALQSNSMVATTVANLTSVAGVTSVLVRENVNVTPLTIDTVTLSPKSIYACVDGGLSADIAAALLRSKSGGCAWNGTTTVSVTEPASGQVYEVSFDYAIPVPMLAIVTVAGASGDPTAAIQQAIIDYSVGEIDGLAGLVIGADVSPFELALAIGQEIPGLRITGLSIGTVAGGTVAPADVVIPVNSRATYAAGNITVVLT